MREIMWGYRAWYLEHKMHWLGQPNNWWPEGRLPFLYSQADNLYANEVWS